MTAVTNNLNQLNIISHDLENIEQVLSSEINPPSGNNSLEVTTSSNNRLVTTARQQLSNSANALLITNQLQNVVEQIDRPIFIRISEYVRDLNIAENIRDVYRDLINRLERTWVVLTTAVRENLAARLNAEQLSDAERSAASQRRIEIAYTILAVAGKIVIFALEAFAILCLLVMGIMVIGPRALDEINRVGQRIEQVAGRVARFLRIR